MKYLIVLFLSSASAFAGTKVQFDIDVLVVDTETKNVFTYDHTYQAEFKPADDDVKAAFSELLIFHTDLPLKRPSNGEVIPLNFGVEIMHLVHPKPDGMAYIVDLDFGPGQPLNDHTRWFSTYLRSLDGLVGFSVNGEEITYPKVGDRTPFVAPVLKIRNFKIINE